MAYAVLPPVSRSYPPPKGMFPYVPHPSATAVLLQPFNLHVLGLPPAFVLSQDQTLILMFNPSLNILIKNLLGSFVILRLYIFSHIYRLRILSYLLYLITTKLVIAW